VHVYESLGRRYEGQRLLRTSRWFWDRADLLQTHLHWHWGLMQLADGQYERAMGRYDEWLREDSATEILNLCDSASLLWRMELLGIDVFDRWTELVPLVRRFSGQHVMPYCDVHIAVRRGTAARAGVPCAAKSVIRHELALSPPPADPFATPQMIYAAAGEESLLAEHMASMAKAATSKPFFEPAMASSVGAPGTADGMRDVDPAWAHLHGAPGAADRAGEAPPPGAAASPPPSLAPLGGPPPSPLAVDRPDLAGLDPPSLRGSAFSPLAAESERRQVSLAAKEDFPLEAPGDADDMSLDPDDQERPILPTPMSSMPILPLSVQVPDFSAAEDGTLPGAAADDPASLPTRAELVSLGGVGGLGLGSHSVVDSRYTAAVAGVALAEGMAAYRQGRSEEAVAKLLPLKPLWHLLGGSRVQRDVFGLTLEAAATQSRQMLLARALLRERATLSPNDGQTMFHLSSVLFATGDYRQAAQSRDRALRFGLGQARHMARAAHPEGAMPKNLEPFRPM